MRIALSTDHAGFEKLQLLQEFLTRQGHQCINFGPQSFNAQDDYPDFIFPAAKAVASGECEFGIIMGGSGQGEAMAANRVKGVRCAVYYGPGAERADGYEILRLSRQHNSANMLSLAARFLSQEEIEKVAKLWLNTPSSVEERHKRRINKLDQLEL